MLPVKQIIGLAILVLSLTNTFCQSNYNTKFGKVKAEDFAVKSSLIDSSTKAIELFDIGTCGFEGNLHGWFSTVFTRHVRIKILNKNGYDAATVRVILYEGEHGREEKIEDVKASTFNLINNEVVETKLVKTDLLSEKYNKKFTKKTFTLPNLKEGSIIEYTYTTRSDYITFLRSWKFEGENPCLYNEYTVAIPDILFYITELKSTLPLKLSQKEYASSYTLMDNAEFSYSASKTFSVNSNIVEKKWSINNVSSIKEEPYLRTVDNYTSKVNFQLKEIRIPNEPVDNVFSSWKKANEKLRKSEYFGEQMYANNHWLQEPLNKIVGNITDTLLQIKKVYEYVRNNFTNTKEEGIYLSDNTTLKDIFNNRKGTSAELNMLLVAMLKRLNIDAEPVILSTRDNGEVHTYFPILSEYDYLIVRANHEGKDYFMDASEPYLGFNKLPLKCYNGYARVLTPDTYPQLFNSNQVEENEYVGIMISGDDKGFTATCQEELGYYKSEKFREEFINKPDKEIIEYLKKDFPIEAMISELNIDSIHNFNNPLKMSYIADFNMTDDIIYLNPLLKYAIKENPYKADTRKYPVERAYTGNYNYSVTVMIPDNYTVDEQPQPTKLVLNDYDGYFEYLISSSKNIIHIKCKLLINKAEYPADNYQY